MTSHSITSIFIVIVALAVAVFAGVSIVTAQLETLGWILVGVMLIACFALGRRIWMILPLLGSLSLTLRIPGQPTSLLVAQFLFIGFTGILFLTRKLPFKIKIGELEFWVIAIIAMVVQVYMRNPVGVFILGADAVGAKPYAIFVISVVVFFILSSYRIPAKELYWYVWLSIIGGISSFALGIFGRFFPHIGVWYGATPISGDVDVDPERAGRDNVFGTAARNLSLWAASFISPLRALLKPHWLFLILVSIAFAAMSGFRNNIAWVGLTYSIALLYRGGIPHFAASAVLGILALGALAFINIATPLPPTIQRSLSFLPGTWDQHIIREAQHSTDWRVEIWEEVLFTDRWIQNKWFGDGLGFTRQELDVQMATGDTTRRIRTHSGFDVQRDAILASADYHSGPVQTIRIIGYVGLAILLIAMFRLGVHAHKLMRRYKGTLWFPLVLFVGLPCIFYPIFFVFVFGTFQIGAATFLASAAMVRVLQRNLPAPEDGVPENDSHMIPHASHKATQNSLAHPT